MGIIWVVIASGVVAFFFIIAATVYNLHVPPTQPNIVLTITGLKKTYTVGERINFNVTVLGESCDYPSAVIVQDSQSDQTVWVFNGSRVNSASICPAVGPGGERTYSTTQGVWDMRWRDSPIIINQTGTYRVVAEFYNETKVHRTFTVDPR